MLFKILRCKKRERNKPGYNLMRVAINNERREMWNGNNSDYDYDDCDDGMDFLSECGDR